MANVPSSIVDELIQLDPSLESHRAELKTLMQKMLDANPKPKLSKAFKKQLLHDLQAQFLIEEHKGTSFSLLETMTNKWLFGTGGVALGALLVLAVQFSKDGNVFPTPSPSPKQMDGAEMAMDSDTSIRTTSPEAFGTLAVSEEGATAPGVGGGGGAVTNLARPQSGGGGGGMDSSMIAPEYTPFKVEYAYDGNIELTDETVSVLKRDKGGSLPAAASSILSDFGNSLLNWSAFPGLRTRTINLVGSGNEPFNITIDFADGSLSLYKEYDYTKRPESNCQDEACFNRYRIKESDIPSDSTLIGTANAFLKKYGIDTSNYGEPIIEDQWKFWLERMEDRSSYYFPETMTVIYPFMVDGLPVYEEYGQVAGMNVNIDIRRKEVSGLYNLQVRNFQSSEYDAITDAEKVAALVKSGGVGTWSDPYAQKTYTGTLGDPKRVYVRHWKWNGNSSEEFYIPALAFPVLFIPEDANTDKRNVIIPLAKDLLPEQGSGIPRPLPVEPFVDPAVMDVPATEPSIPLGE